MWQATKAPAHVASLARGVSGPSVRLPALTSQKVVLTLRLWFAHCQKMMLLMDGLGASMPAQMRRLVGTNALMRNGRGTGLPVSGWMDELTSCLALSYWSRVAASTQTPSLPAALILASQPRAYATASCSCWPDASSVSGLVVL